MGRGEGGWAGGMRRGLGRLAVPRWRYGAALLAALRMRLAYRRARAAGRRHGAVAGRQALRQAHQRSAALLTALCRANGAVWIKFAQFLSCRPDLLPQPYVEALASLQNAAAPVPFAALVPVLEASWGKDWRARIGAIDPVPAATGSVGQVHRARLRDGTEVAVKIRLPGAARSFRRDFAMLRLLAWLLARRVPHIDLRQLVAELLRAIAQELDFSTERDNLARFAALPMHARTRVPRTFPALCGSAVLVTEWVPGKALAEVIRDDRGRAQDLLRVLMDSYVMQITRNGYYHVDPHPGNFMVDAGGALWLLDFGAVGELGQAQARHYRLLLARLLNLSGDDLGELLAAAGFRGGDAQAVAGLSEFFIGAGGAGRKGQPDLAQLMHSLRAQRIGIPDSFVLMMRVLITLGGFMQLHGVRFNVLGMLAPILHERRTATEPILT